MFILFLFLAMKLFTGRVWVSSVLVWESIGHFLSIELLRIFPVSYTRVIHIKNAQGSGYVQFPVRVLDCF